MRKHRNKYIVIVITAMSKDNRVVWKKIIGLSSDLGDKEAFSEELMFKLGLED